MSKKLIDLYKDWMETKTLPGRGLCNSIPEKYDKYLNIIRPKNSDEVLLQREGISIFYWGSGLKYDAPNIGFAFTPLRQTIVLLICAMNNEI